MNLIQWFLGVNKTIMIKNILVITLYIFTYFLPLIGILLMSLILFNFYLKDKIIPYSFVDGITILEIDTPSMPTCLFEIYYTPDYAPGGKQLSRVEILFITFYHREY